MLPRLFILLVLLLSACQNHKAAYSSAAMPDSLTPQIGSSSDSLVTIYNLGSNRYEVCRMMVPVLSRIRHGYEGRVKVVSIDVLEHLDKAREYDVTLLPTQVFVDGKGREYARHSGYFTYEDASKLLEIGLTRK